MAWDGAGLEGFLDASHIRDQSESRKQQICKETVGMCEQVDNRMRGMFSLPAGDRVPEGHCVLEGEQPAGRGISSPVRGLNMI